MICHKTIVVILGGHIVFMITYIHYAHLVSVRFDHSVCRGSLMTTLYIYKVYTSWELGDPDCPQFSKFEMP